MIVFCILYRLLIQSVGCFLMVLGNEIFSNFLFPILLIFLFSSFPLNQLGTINHTQSFCVLETDFGFSLNCNLKKSGLFRVRNLGGLKAHFGLGKLTL